MRKKPNWKPVEIDGIAFAEGASDLIGIEECTDYNIDSFKSRKVSLLKPRYFRIQTIFLDFQTQN